MLHVDLDNILTHDELASKAEEVLHKADDEGKIVVITRNGRPAVAVLKLEQLEELSGRTVSTNQPAADFPGITPPPTETPAPAPEHMDAQPASPQAPQPTEPTPTPQPTSDHTSGLPNMP